VVGAVVALGRGAERVDPSWPPVLIAFVVAAVSAGVISIVVVYRRLRGAGRETDRHRRGTSPR